MNSVQIKGIASLMYPGIRFSKISLSHSSKKQRKAAKVILSVRSGYVIQTLSLWQGKGPHFLRFNILLSVTSCSL